MSYVWIPNTPDPNCKHENAFVTGADIDPPSSRSYSSVYCPDCDAFWDERTKDCKYKTLQQKQEEEKQKIAEEKKTCVHPNTVPLTTIEIKFPPSKHTINYCPDCKETIMIKEGDQNESKKDSNSNS